MAVTGILALIAVCPLLAGCARSAGEKKQTSLGVDDGVEGFLFNFDQREETGALVRYKKKGKMPVKASWHYDPEGELLSPAQLEAAADVTEDPKKISDIYYGLSNTIILGVAINQSSDIKYYISLTLPGGEECRFDFVTENTIRLSNQNYVAETDGSLWPCLVMPERETEDLTESSTVQTPAEEALTERQYS